MSVIRFGAPARAGHRTVVAAAAATALTVVVVGLPLPAAASPNAAGHPHDGAMTVVTVYDEDWDADGTIDVRTTATSVYGSDGLVLSSDWESDTGVDGTIDWAQRETMT